MCGSCLHCSVLGVLVTVTSGLITPVQYCTVLEYCACTAARVLIIDDHASTDGCTIEYTRKAKNKKLQYENSTHFYGVITQQCVLRLASITVQYLVDYSQNPK
jgi:hypothetical protein